MSLTYATTSQIMLLLQTRLQLLGGATPAFGSSLGAQQIDPLLIEQCGESIEASIDATLALIYQLPIISVPALKILRGIFCKLVVAEIVPVHYFATSNPTIGGDAGFGAVIRNEGIKELERYTAGYGVYYSGAGTTTIPRTGNQIQQCVPLPGVPLKATSDVTRPLVPFECYAVDREPIRGQSGFIDWGV